MTKTNATIRVLIGVLMLITYVGCASVPKIESPSEYRNDVAINAKVRAALAKDDDLGSYQINVSTYKGIVHLGGVVQNGAQVDRATKIAQSVGGISSVENYIITEDFIDTGIRP